MYEAGSLFLLVSWCVIGGAWFLTNIEKIRCDKRLFVAILAGPVAWLVYVGFIMAEILWAFHQWAIKK